MAEIKVDTITKEDIEVINSLVLRGILRKIDIGGWECEVEYEPLYENTTYSDGISAWDACQIQAFAVVIPNEILEG